MTPPVFNNITRRTLLCGMATATLATGLRAAPTSPRDARVLVGTYAREGGKGLYTLSHDRARNRWQVEPPVAGIDDASFAVRAPRTGLWYVLREQAKGSVTGFAPGWKARGTMPSGGADPCHAAFDDASGCLAIANYSSGSVGFYRIDPATGAPGEPTIFRHEGTGPTRAVRRGRMRTGSGSAPIGAGCIRSTSAPTRSSPIGSIRERAALQHRSRPGARRRERDRATSSGIPACHAPMSSPNSPIP